MRKKGLSGNAGVKLDRAMFEFPRSSEYFDVRELQTMTGQPADRLADVIVKELLDNAADAAESAGVAPVLSLSVRQRKGRLLLKVCDNGAGIPPETVDKVLDFSIRASDKAAYRSPTRGAQGNALKTVLGIPFALGARAPVLFEARGVRHVVRVRIDPAGVVHVDRTRRDVPRRTGTRVALALPLKSSQATDFVGWGRAFSLFNPHAAVRISLRLEGGKRAYPKGGVCQNSYRPTIEFPGGKWRKFLPTDPTSAWWYDRPALARLLFGNITQQAKRGGQDIPLREFVRQFKGLSHTGKAKKVCDQFPAIKRLSDFADRQELVSDLLDVMQGGAQAPSAGVLGLVGEDHFRRRFDRWFRVKRYWYKKCNIEVAGIPYVAEVAIAETKRPGQLFHAVNFSPTFDDPLAVTNLPCEEFTAYGVGNFLQRAHASPNHPFLATRIAAAFHLVSPALEFLDKGKTRLKVPPQVAQQIAAKALWPAAKELFREEERRRKDAAAQERKDRQRERNVSGKKESLKSLCFRFMRQAVEAAAGWVGRVSAHTVFYHMRPLVQPHASRPLTSSYFEQTLLPLYRREVGPIPEIYYEPRGFLYEPHTGKEVPLGTLAVESYQFPYWLYDKVLFVEKKGLWPTLRAARLAEKYDMAIAVGEGFATEACRVLFDKAEKLMAYQLFVLHDADPWGYNIGRTLREETERMPGHNVAVIDLGLTLEDALRLGLPTEEFTRTKELPRGLVLNDLELDYFEGHQVGRKSWVCRRVELNAFSAPGLIQYTEEGLQTAAVRPKVIPPDEELVARLKTDVRTVVREQVVEEWQRRINEEVDRRVEALAPSIDERAGGLRAHVVEALDADREAPWTWPVREEAEQIAEETAD
jgi:DNA topoisomerase VI subunit B